MVRYWVTAHISKSDGLLTKGRPLEARHETKDFNGKPGRPWIWAKFSNFTLRDIFLQYFSRFRKPMKCFVKMLRYWVTVQISKSDGFPRSSNKRKTVRSLAWNKGFQWEARKTVDLSKKLFISLCKIFFLPYFSRFLKPMKCFAKMLRYWVTVQISKSDVLLTKGRPLEARHETKDFNGKQGKPWIWAQNF